MDCSANRTDLAIGYRTFRAVPARRLSLEFPGAPRGVRVSVSEFTAFGQAPQKR